MIDSVTATDQYLGAFFAANLTAPTDWASLFHAPLRCTVPRTGTSVACEPMWSSPADRDVRFDYPTFSPLVKMQPYSYFYAVAAQSQASKMFDRIIKVSALKRAIVADYTAPNTYFTEPSYVAAAAPTQEDDGYLLSVMYDAGADASALGVFSAATLELLAKYDLQQVIPFHAHGVSCRGTRCFTNP